MKKIKYSGLAIMLLLVLSACDETTEGTNEELNSDENFTNILQAKDWKVTSFIYKLTCADEGNEGNQDLELVKLDFCVNNNESCSACPEDDPDCTPTCYEYCGLKYDWLNYEVSFTASQMTGTQKVKKYTATFENGSSQVEYEEEDQTIVYNSAWEYNEDDQILTTNFGDVYNYFDGDDFLTFPFEIKSNTTDLIVLEGQITEQGCSLYLDIILE